jgi:hypothetical protein
MIQRIWPDTRVSWRTRSAQEYRPRDSGGGASPDAGGVRRSRDGYLLALHIVLLFAAGRNPTDIAAVLFYSRSSVYRTVRAYREGTLSWEHDEQGAAPDTTAVADGPAQGTPVNQWLVPHAMGVPRWPSHCKASGGSRSRPRPCATSCMISAGCGNTPSWWRKRSAGESGDADDRASNPEGV